VHIGADRASADADAGSPTVDAGASSAPVAVPGDAQALTRGSADPGAQTAPAVSSVAAINGVLRVKPFRRLWYATALSSLGDWLGLLATTALATSLASGYQAQNYALGGVLIVRLLPAILLGPLAGAFADRFDRRRTMVVGDAVRFVLFMTIPLAHLVVDRHQTLVWLYVASFLIECISLFWMPAKDASVPNLVRRDQVEAANQLSLITTYGLTPVLGAALFSVLSLITNVLARHLSFFRTQPTNLALYMNAATFLFGALIVFFIREISGHGVGRPVGEKPPGLLRLMRGGRHLRRLVAAGRRADPRTGRRVRGRRHRDRRRKDLRNQPRRRQRRLRRAVRGRVRRPRLGHGPGATHRARAFPATTVRLVDRVRRYLPVDHRRHAAGRAGGDLRARRGVRRRYGLPVGHDPYGHRR